MNIAVYTLTRDRIEYTQRSFAALRENAGCEFHHFVFDNGSEDGTHDWLRKEWLAGHSWADFNLGISVASNLCLRDIFEYHEPHDLIVKMDNDCIVQSPNILAEFARIYQDPAAQKWALSPRVIGINRQPARVRRDVLAGHEIGVTSIIGGLFHVLPAAMYRQFFEDGGYDENLPLAKGQDEQLAEWLRRNGYEKGYVEDLIVEHCEGTDAQAKRYPQYFRRKWDVEEKRR